MPRRQEQGWPERGFVVAHDASTWPYTSGGQSPFTLRRQYAASLCVLRQPRNRSSSSTPGPSGQSAAAFPRTFAEFPSAKGRPRFETAGAGSRHEPPGEAHRPAFPLRAESARDWRVEGRLMRRYRLRSAAGDLHDPRRRHAPPPFRRCGRPTDGVSPSLTDARDLGDEPQRLGAPASLPLPGTGSPIGRLRWSVAVKTRRSNAGPAPD